MKNYFKIVKVIFVFSTLTLLFQNCGVTNSQNQTTNQSSLSSKANFTWIDENIIQMTCTECHHPGLAFSGLDFTTYEGVMEAIQPGEPSFSSFYTRSFTTQFFELTDEEREIIRLWILNGASR